MKITSSYSESNTGARAIECEDKPTEDETQKEKNHYQECSTARHRRHVRQDYRIYKIAALYAYQMPKQMLKTAASVCRPWWR
jgi:hypothetical protein